MAEECLKKWITVTYGGAGFFAVLVGLFRDDEMREYQDCILTGIGRYRSSVAASVEAIHWAEAESLDYIK